MPAGSGRSREKVVIAPHSSRSTTIGFDTGEAARSIGMAPSARPSRWKGACGAP
jgi:hypothetical protein